MSEKGEIPGERSKGGPKKSQKEQLLRSERTLEELEGDDLQVEESLREKERKPNR